jgi:hypothetical protein
VSKEPERLAIKVGTQSHRTQKRGINRINTIKPSEFVFMDKSRDEHGYVKGGSEWSKIRQRACDAILQ